MNCLGYSIYGILLPDSFVFVANMVGLLLALYYSLSAVTLLARAENIESTRNAVAVKGALVFAVVFWSVVGMVCSEIFQGSSRQMTASMIGAISACFCVIYYASPLSTMFEVIATKNAATLYAPMISVNFLNALLWTLYGYYGMHHAPIWIPNLIGVILAFFQLVLVVVFRRSTPEGGSGSYRPVAHEEGISPGTAFVNYKTTIATHTHK